MSVLRKLLIAAGLAWMPLSPSVAADALASTPVVSLRVAVPGNIFASLDKATASGVFVEAVDALLRQQGKVPTYLTMSANDALQDLQSGALGAATVLVPTDRVRESAYLSDPIVTEYNVVIAPKGKAFALNRLADLQGKRIGVRAGYQYPLLDRDAALQVVRFQSDGELMRALLFGQVDAAVISAISDVYAFRAEGIMPRLEVLKMAVGSVPLVAAFSRQQFSREQVDAFNRALVEFKRRREWQQILERNGVADLVKEWPLVSE